MNSTLESGSKRTFLTLRYFQLKCGNTFTGMAKLYKLSIDSNLRTMSCRIKCLFECVMRWDTHTHRER